MATITKYTAQQQLDPDAAGMPRVNLTPYMARAIEGLGGAISDAAAAFQQRDETKENFKAEVGYRRLNLGLDRDMNAAAENMAEDGAGFHDDFFRGVYAPARKQFLDGLPPRLRERYELLLGDEGPDTDAWSIKAATKERDRLYSWTEGALGESREQLATAISMDPDAYDTLLQQGMAEIDSSPLPTETKEAQRKAWEHMAQVAHLNRLIETNPERVLRELGADPRYLTPTTQYGLLKRALVQQESGGNPNAISPKGAIGTMQVMPGTAKDIARWIKDENFNQSWSDEQITEYLSNPETNELYGDFYLKKQIRDFSSKGGLEAALIAYNGGPGRAQEWIDSGFDDSVLPDETRKYYKAIMANLPLMPGQKDMPAGDASKVTLEWAEGYGGGKPDGPVKNVNPDLVRRVQTSFAALGIDNIKVRSGHRDHDANKKAGGARGSQHLAGNAFDIDVTGYSNEKRVAIIRALSANGITGLGIGSNIIHADLGARRAWGYKTSAGGGPVPPWAKVAIDEHLANTAATPRRAPGVGGRYSTLPYQQRQQFIAGADKAVTALVSENAKATVAQKGDMRRSIDNELATIRATGQSTGVVDESTIAGVLGEEAYNKYMIDLDTAQRTFAATDGVAQMTSEEMNDRLRDYRPEPGAPTFARDQQVEAAVQRAIERTMQERTRRPVEAAMKYDDVAEAWAEIENAETPDPAAVQAYVQLNLERQKEFNLKPGSEQPVPRQWALEIGRALSRLPSPGQASSSELNAAILLQYEALQKVFGDYTDEVILQALSEYKGVGKNTAELLTGYMQAIQSGGDPMGRIRQRLDAAVDRDQVEQMAEPGLWDRVTGFLFGGDSDTEAGALLPEDAGQPDNVLNEKVLRVMNMIQSYGSLEPEDEAYLVERYGESAVRLAKERVGSR